MNYKIYEDYKKSSVEWMGIIPSHWNIQKVKFLTENLDNKRIPVSADERKYGPIPYYGATGIVDYVDNYIFNEELLLIGEDGAPFFDKTKNVAFIISGKTWVNNHAHVLRVNEEKILKKLLMYVLNVTDYSLYIMGSTRDKLNQDQLKNIPIIVPPIDEQMFIVDYLDKKISILNKLIRKNRKLIELLVEKMTSLINKVITKGLNPNVPMKDSNIEWIGAIPEHWTVDRLKHRIILNKKSLNDSTDKSYEFHYVDIGSVSLENGIEKYETMLFKDSPSRARRIVKKDDVIISTVRTYLKAIATIPDKEDIIVSTGFAVLTPYTIHSRYLGYMVKTEYFTNSVSAHSVGVSYPAINASDLVNLDILVPPTDEQIQIADFLDKETKDIHNLILKTKKTISLLEEYKYSLIYHVVTGKIDVRGEDI